MLHLFGIYRVTLADQATYEAQVVGFDQDKDVAVLSIDAPKEKLRPIPVGISSDLLVGQKVYAIGNPVSESTILLFQVSSFAIGFCHHTRHSNQYEHISFLRNVSFCSRGELFNLNCHVIGGSPEH